MQSTDQAVALPDPEPMFTRPAHPDAHHRVTAPGGYEWWYVDAESHDGRTHVVAILFDGYVFHPAYLRADARFRRQPTKVRPAIAADFPCAYCVVYRDGSIHRQFLTQVRPKDFEAATNRLHVRVGDCTLSGDGDQLRLAVSGTPWKLTAQGPKLIEDETLSVDLQLQVAAGLQPAVGTSNEPSDRERIFLSRAMTGEHHGWIPAAPRCAVEGTVAGEPFQGRAYHDHNYGTGPLGPGLRRWVWGRVFTDDRLVSFHLAEPADRALPAERHAFEATDAGFSDVPADELAADWSRRSKTGLPFPRTIRLGDRLQLSEPKVIDDSPFYLRVAYDAVVDGNERVRALCEVGHPHRLRWPVLGRMIEMSIDKRRLQG
ncbi:MAG: hypothetical protein AAGI46_13760 [Planctomycetota bacterium]